ncbi:MAG: threonine/serine dehydratase [Thermoplasmatota archaeon]
MVTLADIRRAHARIRPMVNRTPVMTSTTLDERVEVHAYLKCENFQKAGSFKMRGVSNRLLQLSDSEKRRGVTAHSSGNHAQAVALAASILGIPSVIVMPRNAPEVKVAATRGYGAEVVFCENSAEAREKRCRALADEHGYVLVHPYDDDRVIAGAGTAALELLEETGDLDYVFCPVGGGGLISGTSIAVKGICESTVVVGVEPALADDAYRSFRDGRLYPSEYPDTIADGLRTSLSRRTFAIIRRHVDEMVTVSEREIVEAMKFLWTRMKMVVEPSGAVSLAGMLKKEGLEGTRVGVIVSGGNVGLDDCFERYYAALSQE